jgi:hypothetical protein
LVDKDAPAGPSRATAVGSGEPSRPRTSSMTGRGIERNGHLSVGAEIDPAMCLVFGAHASEAFARLVEHSMVGGSSEQVA